MKHHGIQYLALDVHQAAIVASVRDETGAVRMRATVATVARAILGLVKGLGARVHVVFEEGTQAQWLHDLLVPHAERVVVCNVRGKGEMDNKNDRLDADGLSERLRLGVLKTVYHGSPGLATLKELVRCYTNLVDDSTRVMLRLKALYRGRAISTSGEAVYRPSQRKVWLAKLKATGARTRAASLLAQLDVLLGLRRKCRAAMIAEARRQPGWKILSTMPFFGPVRVAIILAVIATPLPVPRQAAALAVRWIGRHYPNELGEGARRGQAAAEEARTADTRAQSKPQPAAQERVQGSGQRRCRQARPAQRFL